MLYKMPISSSSKIFVSRVFWRLRNHTFYGHISRLEQDRANLKPLLPTKSPMPYRLVALPCRSRDHTTSGLAFLAFRSHKNRRKRYHGNVPGRGTWALAGQVGPRTGGHGVARVDSDHAECGGVSNRINRLRFIGFCHYDTLGPGANMKVKISPAALPADLPKSRGL